MLPFGLGLIRNLLWRCQMLIGKIIKLGSTFACRTDEVGEKQPIEVHFVGQ